MYFLLSAYVGCWIYSWGLAKDTLTLTNNPKSIKVIAVGNDLYGDDGIGNAVLQVLEQIPDMNDIELIDGATDALGLIDHFLRNWSSK